MDVGHCRRDVAGTGHHDLDLLAGQGIAQRQPVRQQAGFRGRVGRRVRQRHERGQRRHQDDPTLPSLSHLRQNDVHRVDRREEVGLENLPRRIAIFERLVGVAAIEDPGIRDERVQGLLTIETVEEVRQSRGVPDVDGARPARRPLRSAFFRHLLEAIGVAADQRQRAAGTGQPSRQRGADSAGGSGDGDRSRGWGLAHGESADESVRLQFRQ